MIGALDLIAFRILMTRKKRVLNTVFGAPELSQPTPVATPATGFIAPDEAFGALPPRQEVLQHDINHRHALGTSSIISHATLEKVDNIQDQARWDRSWHTVTHTLALPNAPPHLNLRSRHEIGHIFEGLSPRSNHIGREFHQALQDILDPQARLPLATYTEEIILWHTHQVRNHFLNQILPVILRIINDHKTEASLSVVIEILKASHQLYLDGMNIIVGRAFSESGSSRNVHHLPQLCRDLHAVVSNSVSDKLAPTLQDILRTKIYAILGIPTSAEFSHLKLDYLVPKGQTSELLQLLESLQEVGLSGERLQTTLAEIMHDSLTSYVNFKYKGIWSDRSFPTAQSTNERIQPQSSVLARKAHYASRSQCVAELCEWIENQYAQLAVRIFDVLRSEMVRIPWNLVTKWKDMGIARLADLRTDELFDIVASWPNSSGALEDLKTAITTPQKRLHLTEVFASALNKRLLHPGASTLQILQYYVSMISSFHALDHSKVLLDRVAHPLQLYLYSREDTVRVIITGLLSDTVDAEGSPLGRGSDRLHQLAALLNNGEDAAGLRPHDDELDWHDKDWMPDPVDAGPGYKRSKTADIIGTLIRALGTQEVFIKEFQNIIGENLLRQDGGFDKEVKVLELLKSRFGEAPLQSCEVMLKDIQDSARVNSIIKRAQKLDNSDDEGSNAQRSTSALHPGKDRRANTPALLRPSLNAKILSRLFWPQLHDETYRVPDDILELQKTYATGFESLKTSRKLTWLHALGQATVELELKDRIVVEEVHTWQATVIWAFQSNEGGDDSLRRSVDDLVEHLEMDETLVRSALKFWTSKLVLQAVEKDVYAVLETLNQEDRARSNARAATSAAAAPEGSTDDTTLMTTQGISKEKRQLYWQFIQGMLKNNSSQMPLMQIAMMLKMLLPDGFPLSNEELQEFLGTIVADGALEFVGGKYKLKK
ncbi:hypothetical protein B0O99DRAFT_647646 [Bisporella sp. PMI_857]|nr:hypothetical protein B0O99DRAFT_647646 [Bisporella sp. PMI_857]